MGGGGDAKEAVTQRVVAQSGDAIIAPDWRDCGTVTEHCHTNGHLMALLKHLSHAIVLSEGKALR